MGNYDDIVKSLRICNAFTNSCDGCVHDGEPGKCYRTLMRDAISAINELCEKRDAPRGRWVKKHDDVAYWYECSVCHNGMPRGKHGGDWFSCYCPSCGARMGTETDKEEEKCSVS